MDRMTLIRQTAQNLRQRKDELDKLMDGWHKLLKRFDWTYALGNSEMAEAYMYDMKQMEKRVLYKIGLVMRLKDCLFKLTDMKKA